MHNIKYVYLSANKGFRATSPILRYSSEYRVKKTKTKQKGLAARPDPYMIDKDYIGPPEKVSNLRTVVRHIKKDETPLETQLRLKQIEVEKWNQDFWENHNKRFFQEKEDFIKLNRTEEDTLSADKMSEFYKKFLDENWRKHFEYNRNWYKKNFQLLMLSFRVKFQSSRLFRMKS